jgi:hypothetical protein
MADEVEDVHHAFPHCLALECLADRDGSGELRRATVLAFDDIFELWWPQPYLRTFAWD